MCFDCNNFQFQLDNNRPLEDHVFQTIFLNKEHKHLWSKDEINKDKIIREDWWHQLCHSWTHYAFVVPFMRFINKSPHTTYAAAWTMVNAHEVAIISGMVSSPHSMCQLGGADAQAAAYKLGADYPQELREDKMGRTSFEAYLRLAHAMPLKGGNLAKDISSFTGRET